MSDLTARVSQLEHKIRCTLLLNVDWKDPDHGALKAARAIAALIAEREAEARRKALEEAAKVADEDSILAGQAAAEAAAKAYSARTLHPAYVMELHSRITASVVRHQVARKPWKAAP